MRLSSRTTLATSLALLGSACLVRHGPSAPAAPHGVEFRNGRWFDGDRFVTKTMYVADGVFLGGAPVHVDSVVDLRGGWVVPPFADAHHHLYDPSRAAQYIASMLRDGIFYVKDQSNAPAGRRMFERLVNIPTSIDFISANQGWTSPGGHPVEVIGRAAQMPGPMGAFVRDSLDPGLVMQVETPADVDRRWPYFVAGRPAPDFVKVFLQHSEEHAQRRSDPKAFGRRGLDPALVPYIVKRAHESGFQVSAHVFTAADFRAAVDAGVDQIAHTPGAPTNDAARYLITDADAANAAAHHVTAITTVTKEEDSTLTERLVREQYGPNLAMLRKHGVRLLIGSDLPAGNAVTEAAALARSGLFSNLELLRLWSVTTPQSIFPKRKLGAFMPGFEASFLVLGGDPLADFANTRRITLRVKQGTALR